MNNVVRDDRARQGPKGKPVLGVLIGAMVLCVVALAGYMMWAGSQSPDSASQDASRQATTGTPNGSASSNPSNRTKPENPAYPAPAEPTATGTAKP
jgi:flagellar basal body-associated protein FliL